MLATKDEDFHSLAVLLGPPPKVVWVCLGNCSTAVVSKLLTAHRDAIERFASHDEFAVLPMG